MGRCEGICYIVGARPLEPGLCPRPEAEDLVIAADGGYAGLMAAGVIPNLVVGDFDSLGAPPEHPEVVVLPQVKDDTDMIYAARQGLERGYRRFVLLGGMGGRLDHTVANLQTLDWLAGQGARAVLAGEGAAAAALRRGSLTFPGEMAGYVSVFCSSGTARGVDLSGLKYQLEDADLVGDFPLGVSNEFIGQPARIRVEEGSLLILWEERGDLYQILPWLWKET